MDRGAKKVFLFVIIGIIFFPRDVFAWGPVVHLDCAMQVVTGAIAVAPTVYQLISRHSYDFIYGALLADFIVGKKHAAERDHCHNWSVARDLLRDARREGAHREAFMLGYINHLGADVVAHNHVVPEMLITHFNAKGVGHLYWEARADQRTLSVKESLADVWNTLSKLRFPGHNRFLQIQVRPTIFPNRMSGGLYRTNLDLQRKGVWRRAFQRIDEKSKLYYSSSDLLLWRRLASQSGARAMDNPWSRRLDHLDPIGRKALATAEAARKSLRRELRRHGETHRLAAMLRRARIEAKTIDIHHFEED